jgi:predicted kinase
MIVIVLGLPGSGKTFFASRLALSLEALYISSDQTRIAMKALGKYTFEDKLAVYREMAKRADQALELGKNIIVDGTFYHHKMRNLFTTLAKFYDTPIRFIEVTAREEIIKERLKKKRKESEADYEVYQLVRKQFEQLDMPHFKTRSDQDNIEEMLSAALNYLKEKNA